MDDFCMKEERIYAVELKMVYWKSSIKYRLCAGHDSVSR
jgi:hypothetical protein